eukprot:scaffold114428_cov48-Phaeocystis_antarctica.AAC.1
MPSPHAQARAHPLVPFLPPHHTPDLTRVPPSRRSAQWTTSCTSSPRPSTPSTAGRTRATTRSSSMTPTSSRRRTWSAARGSTQFAAWTRTVTQWRRATLPSTACAASLAASLHRPLAHLARPARPACPARL